MADRKAERNSSKQRRKRRERLKLGPGRVQPFTCNLSHEAYTNAYRRDLQRTQERDRQEANPGVKEAHTKLSAQVGAKRVFFINCMFVQQLWSCC
jgi:hypothetical protein